MGNTLKYRGYLGSVEVSDEDDTLYGRLLGIKEDIVYEGRTVEDLREDFHEAVDAYLIECEEEGIRPQVPFKGSFKVRVSPALHERLAQYAYSQRCSVNTCVQEALERYLVEMGQEF